MRTLRLSLAGTVILMLLGGPSGVVAAGDEEAPSSDGPHPVSGTNTYAGIFEHGNHTFEEGRALQRGYGSFDTIEMDDARLSGTLWHVWNRDYIYGPGAGSRVDGEVLTGTVELVNDDGSWVGTMRGYKTHEPGEPLHYWQLELTGTGAYEGHTALLYHRGVTEYLHEVEGFVFPGPLPEYPDPVEVPGQ